MGGRIVPNISFGPVIVETVRLGASISRPQYLGNRNSSLLSGTYASGRI